MTSGNQPSPVLTPCGRIPDSPLTDGRERFCQEIVSGTPILEAYHLAGFKRCMTCEDGTKIDIADLRDVRLTRRQRTVLRANADRMRNQPVVKERIGELARRGAELAGIYDGWILARIKEIADVSIADFCRRNDDGSLALDSEGRPIIDMRRTPERLMRCIKSLKWTRDGRPILELESKEGILDKLMRHRGLYADRDIGAPADERSVVRTPLPAQSPEQWQAEADAWRAQQAALAGSGSLGMPGSGQPGLRPGNGQVRH